MFRLLHYLTRYKDNFRKILVCAIFMTIISALFPSNTDALMESPRDRFERMPESEIISLKRVEKLQNYFNIDDIIFSYFSVGHKKKLFHIVRMANKCKDWCLTAFFKDHLSNEGFMGVGLFPIKSTKSDVLTRLVRGCGHELGVLFVSSDGKNSKTVLFSRCGVLF